LDFLLVAGIFDADADASSVRSTTGATARLTASGRLGVVKGEVDAVAVEGLMVGVVGFLSWPVDFWLDGDDDVDVCGDEDPEVAPSSPSLLDEGLDEPHQT